MKFLVGAQLPRRLAVWLRESGHDAVHTLDLPQGNRTTDHELATLAANEQRIVATKDADFVDSYFVSRTPERLLLVTTGNISNADLTQLFQRNLPAIAAAFETGSFVEIGRGNLVVHE